MGCLQDFFDGGAIAEADWGSGGVHRELAGEIPRDLRFVLQNELLEFAYAIERPAIGQFAPRIDGQRIVKVERPAVLALSEFRQLVLRITAVAVAPAAHDIEVLERKTLRIDFV